ncbi:MAG TPA: hypothetical protein VIM48_05870 [Chthoniobacterales bacterium]
MRSPISGDATRFENTGIKTPTSLGYRVRAYNRNGSSPYSNGAP